MRFEGDELKSVAARPLLRFVTGTNADPDSTWLGPQSGYWGYLQNGGAYMVSYDSPDHLSGTLTLLPSFFDCASTRAVRGPVELFCRFRSGAGCVLSLLLDDNDVRLIR